MTAMRRETPPIPSDDVVEREARRILRRLSEPGACLAVAKDMEKAVVVREAGGQTVRTGVVDRPVAEAMALNDWIACETPGRISRYQITQAGRAALKRLLAEDAQDAFGDQHRDIEERDETGADGRRTGARVRYTLAESPLALLARRRDKDGQAFLTDRMVLAGERLREDFELAQMGPRVAQNWDRFLTAGADRGGFATGGSDSGSAKARDRVALALRDLGPGLGDVVLRCCCFLEGLEAAEKRLGWSARSGKIVLRIALQRLKRHYDETYGGKAPLIG
jgi:DNA-binding PadR family transcriptional regulator